MEDDHRRRQQYQQGAPELQLDYMFLGRENDTKTLTLRNTIDMTTFLKAVSAG